MTHADDRADRPSLPTRRATLGSIGTLVGTLLAGCLGAGAGPTYGADDPDRVPVDVEGDDRTPEEVTAAASLAEQQPAESVSAVDGLVAPDHEFVLEDGYLGSTVQGTVENRRGGRVALVEVRVRVYDDAGDLLGTYMARTADLEGNHAWSFTVVILESPNDIGAYDIGVQGAPG